MKLHALTLVGALALASSASAQPPPAAPPPMPAAGAAQARPLPPLPIFQERFRRRVMEADTNHDGRISLSEWLAWRAQSPKPPAGDPTRAFQRMDLNHDGFLTPDEIDAAAVKMYQRREARSGGMPPGAEDDLLR